MTPAPGAPNPPTWLSAEAKAEWRRIVPKLEAAGILATIDRAGLALVCEAWSEYRAADRILKREGLTYKSEEDGITRRHPMMKVKNDAAIRWAQLSQRFGLTPSDRTRIKAPIRDNGKDEGKSRFFGGESA